MDPLSKLPPECLHLIINHLAYEEPPPHANHSNSTHLASLLQTNKYLASVTLPYLYSNPYDLSFHESGKYYFNADKSGFVLARMLLSRPAVINTLPDILAVAMKAAASYIAYEDDPFAYYYIQLEDNDDDEEEEEEDTEDSTDEDTDEDVSEDAEEDVEEGVEDEDIEVDAEVNVEEEGEDVEDDSEPDADEEEREEKVEDSENDNDEYYKDDGSNSPDPYDEDDIKPDTPSSLDYFSQMRHLTLSKWQIDIEHIWPNGNGRTRGATKFKDFIKENKIEQQRSTFFKSNLRDHYHDLLYQEAMWALGNPILEQLQSMYIPVCDIHRYLDVISRLGKLETVEFVMWDPFDYPTSTGATSLPNITEAVEDYKRQLLRTMVDFVKEHARLFPGCLKTTTFHNDGFWRKIPSHRKQEIQFEIFEMLPPLPGIKVLKEIDLVQCLAHTLSVNLERVEKIAPEQTPLLWLERPEEAQHLLKRCQSLQSLESIDLPAGCFKWAVEKRRRMINPSGDTTITINNTNSKIKPPTQATSILADDLPPLSNVSLWDRTSTFTDDLNDIAFAFSPTLKQITVQPTTTHTPAVLRQMTYGRGWINLPLLTHLSLDTGYDRLVIDRELLTHCPNVVTVMLRDHTTEYRCQDIVPCSPALLVKVDKLHMIGWSALTFHPATLHLTPELTELRIMMCRFSTNRHYIPPLEELTRSYGAHQETAEESSEESAPGIIRPFWSWDWHLPMLTNLNLSGEFAFCFQFRMLLGCPSLHTLYLDMCSSDEQHVRVLSLQELFFPRTTNVDPTAEPLWTVEPIVAPSLRKLTMLGHWVVSDEVMMTFLKFVFPELESLREELWSGYTLALLVGMFRILPIKLKRVKLDVPDLSPEELPGLGLWRYYGGRVVDSPGPIVSIGGTSLNGYRPESHYIVLRL
ncbi:hypothetical protein BG015_011035 [Linnemannia schmuckeri]|uniref:Uncharacterized protein n=1 Tax=Linnemannia schmuckeri TaxID=64567 RepID=A0A9P5RTN7_9FUNG|nr:hypothetical protein BG015_011035 [Linnemannia schmuckeri]